MGVMGQYRSLCDGIAKYRQSVSIPAIDRIGYAGAGCCLGLGLKALTKIRGHENSKQGMRGISDLRLSYSSLTHKT